MKNLSVIVPYRDTPYSPFGRFLQSVGPAIGKQIDWELIIVDDASRKPLETSAQVLKTSFGNRIKIVTHAHHQGIGEARNTGFRASLGEYVFMCDSDDVLRVGSIERMMSAATPRRVVYADHVVHDTIQGQTYNRRKEHWQRILEAFGGTENCPLLFCNFVGLPVLLSRTTMKRTGGYPRARSAGEHVAFYGALSRDASVEFFHHAYMAYEYWIRVDGISSSNRGGTQRQKESLFRWKPKREATLNGVSRESS